MPKKGWGVPVCLILMSMPLLIPWNVVGAMWNIFALPDIGFLGYSLNAIGFDFNFTQQPGDAWFTTILMDVWHWTSLVVLLSYAGLRSIQPAYYQAAEIDGASRWAVFRHIELPKMKKVLTIAILLRFMDSFMIYTEPFVLTGGGPGIMEAANKGAAKNKGKSVGLCIDLPYEVPNKFIDKDKLLNFDYFFVRKVMFIRYSQGFVVMPGGFGTLDEVFEAATLIQTEEAEKFPIILVCSEYWGGVVDWIKETMLLENNHISEEDLSLLRIADTKEEVISILEEFHNNYEFSPNF